MKRLSQSSHMAFPKGVATPIDPVFVDDPTLTRLNTKNYLRSAPDLSCDTNSYNSYSETQIVIKDYSSDDEKLDKDFRKAFLLFV